MLSWEKTSFKTLAIENDVYGGICQRAWIEVNDQALIYNVQQLKSLLSAKTQLMGVVKADAYGHGACKISKTILEATRSANSFICFFVIILILSVSIRI